MNTPLSRLIVLAALMGALPAVAAERAAPGGGVRAAGGAAAPAIGALRAQVDLVKGNPITVAGSVLDQRLAAAGAAAPAEAQAAGFLSKALTDPKAATALQQSLAGAGEAQLAQDIGVLSARAASYPGEVSASFASLDQKLAPAIRNASPDELKSSLDQLFANAGGKGDAGGAAVKAEGTGSAKVLLGLKNPNAVQTQTDIAERIEVKKPKAESFVKDAPILGYKITSDKFEDLPAAIRAHIGAVDQTKYTPEYLKANMGSMIALQMKDGKPDFYIVGKGTFDQKYKVVPAAEVGTKNGKLMKGLAGVDGIEALAKSDPNVIGALKIAPTEMIKMSDLKYPIDKAVTIESPWGAQTKPAGKDAYLVLDTTLNPAKYYMVNVDDAGLPASYVRPPLPQQSAKTLIDKAAQLNPAKQSFIKDAPILGYKITSDKFEDLPAAIRDRLGEVDKTSYKADFLKDKVGSIIALQMNGDKPDFYPIGKDAFGKYKAVRAADVATKNAKLFKNVLGVPGMAAVLEKDQNVGGFLKTVPVEMISMSSLGYDIGQEVSIESPWGTQTKPAGKDAFLVWDAGKNMFYMVNVDDAGLPISYVVASK